MMSDFRDPLVTFLEYISSWTILHIMTQRARFHRGEEEKMSTTLEKRAVFPDLRREQCIALTTYRKTGQAVMTPVWFAESLGTIYVETHADAGKLKRIAHTRRVTLAPCRYNGKVTGALSAGNARILTKPEECAVAAGVLARKYGIMRSLHHFLRDTQCRLQRKAKVEEAYIAIIPII